MRVAHVIRRLSFDDWGGTEQVVWNLAKAQRAAGHDVRLFATTALCATPHETVDGLEIVRFRPVYPWWPMPKALVAELDRKGGNPFVPGLGKALREWRPDVIHCHAMARIAELCLRVGARRRCVVSLHGGGANVPTEEAKSLKAPTRGRLPWGKAIDILMGWTRRVPEDFGGIVCVGEDEYLKYREKHRHVMFLPNGVDTRLFETRHPALPQTHQPIRLLCVARIDRQKNQMALVEALARHPGIMLRLVGPVTQQDYREELEARAAALGVADRVAFVGALKPGSPELIAEYAGADAFVLPSRHEPFGIVVLEAWAAGLPVAASDIGGLGRLCAAHPDAAIRFPADDASGLDCAISELLRRMAGGEAGKMSEAGRRAAAQYDWGVLAARLVDFYAETGKGFGGIIPKPVTTRTPGPLLAGPAERKD